MVHTFREGNQLTGFFTNYAINFVGTEVQKFNDVPEIPQQPKSIIQLEKSHTPNIRVKKIQNRKYKV